MARSSGTQAIPRRAMRSEDRPVMSLPSRVIVPRRSVTTPITDFRVVVFPAPLRPIRLTTSPGRTSSETPCRTWLFP